MNLEPTLPTADWQPPQPEARRPAPVVSGLRRHWWWLLPTAIGGAVVLDGWVWPWLAAQ